LTVLSRVGSIRQDEEIGRGTVELENPVPSLAVVETVGAVGVESVTSVCWKHCRFLLFLDFFDS